MKTVISEDNLSAYFLEKKDLDLIDISKVNRKIKTKIWMIKMPLSTHTKKV